MLRNGHPASKLKLCVFFKGLLSNPVKSALALGFLQRSEMGQLTLRELVLGITISVGLANSLRIDLDVHLGLSGDDPGMLETHKTSKLPLTPKVADLTSVDLPYERHKASPPGSVSLGDFSYVLFKNLSLLE